MNSGATQPGPPDYDHDPAESQPLGPVVKPKPKPIEDEHWYPVPGSPGIEVNDKGQFRTVISPPKDAP